MEKDFEDMGERRLPRKPKKRPKVVQNQLDSWQIGRITWDKLNCWCNYSSAEYLKINPLGYVPAIKDGDFVLADSFAIALYLEEKYPEHPLLPNDLKKTALNYQVANITISSTQPLLRLPILAHIGRNYRLDEMISWADKHCGKGFAVGVSDVEDDKLHDDIKVAEKHTALHSALSKLAGDFDGESMMFLQRFFLTRVKPVVSTGSLKLDLALGIGGLPKGRIVEIYGHEASGKTT